MTREAFEAGNVVKITCCTMRGEVVSVKKDQCLVEWMNGKTTLENSNNLEKLQ